MAIKIVGVAGVSGLAATVRCCHQSSSVHAGSESAPSETIRWFLIVQRQDPLKFTRMKASMGHRKRRKTGVSKEFLQQPNQATLCARSEDAEDRSLKIFSSGRTICPNRVFQRRPRKEKE